MTNIKKLNTNLLGINQISFTSTESVVYDIYLKDLLIYEYFKDLDGLTSLYLVFNHADVYFKENNENKCLIFASTNKNKEALENYTELWDKPKNKTETIKGIESIKYEKDFMKTRFKSDNSLPLGKIINIPLYVIIVKSVFQENDKYYP